MSIIWEQCTKSGLGDRLLDTSLLLTYARLKQKKLKTIWAEHPRDGSDWEKLRPGYRWEDYKLVNLKKYMKLPQDIILLDIGESIIPTKNDIIFTSYLGGIYSPTTFREKYLPKTTQIDFMKIFNKVMSEFEFQNLPTIPDIDICVHVRRTDKMHSYVSQIGYGINSSEIGNLDSETYKAIDIFIKRGSKSIFICSDDKEEKKKYQNKYKNMFINMDCINDVKQTYLDLYVISKSKYTILSQRSSNFSMFGTMINQSNLIYLYKDSTIVKNKFNNLINVHHVSALSDELSIIGHQGYTDFLSQNSIYQFFIDIYSKITILVSTLDRITFVGGIYNQQNVHISLPETDNKYDGQRTCIHCHTYGTNKSCPRMKNKKCEYILYEKYPNIIKLCAFDNYQKWSHEMNKPKISFSHLFYDFHFISLRNRIEKFYIERDCEKEQIFYDRLNSKNLDSYILIHDDLDRDVLINRGLLPKLPSIQLNQQSNITTDSLKLIEKSDEVHMIDSVYACLSYFMCLKYRFAPQTKFFLHTYCRNNRDMGIFCSPKPSNWIYL